MLQAHIRSLYDAEHRLCGLLPKLADRTESRDMRAGLRKGFESALRRVYALETLFSDIGESPQRESYPMIAELMGDIQELDAVPDDAARDLQLVTLLQRIQAYLLAGYGAARVCAKALDRAGVTEQLERMAHAERESAEAMWTLVEDKTRVGNGGN